MKYDLVVFDWDGTLLDSAGAIVPAIQAACRDVGHPSPSDDQARHVIGLGLADAMRHAVPDLPLERYQAVSYTHLDVYKRQSSACVALKSMRFMIWGLQRTKARCNGVPSRQRQFQLSGCVMCKRAKATMKVLIKTWPRDILLKGAT